MKIIDSFIFYNELDLLYYRLSILDKYIDTFILVESTHTFSGKPKPLYYQDNKEMFAKFNHKIVHIIISDFAYKFPSINYMRNEQWENEYHQRNSIKLGIEKLIGTLTDDDIILTSDVDEIPNPVLIENILNNNTPYDKNLLNRLALDMYYYNLCYRIGEGSNWHGVKLLTVCAYKVLNLTFQQMRVLEHSQHVPIIANGGWHLSYFGDVNFIKAKISSFSHQEYNNNKYIDEEKLKLNIETGINLLNNSRLNYIPLQSNTNLPYRYEIYLSKYT
jgi:beta-1,4-mannosyl-glycoprotein beta-1,4-N-acetylglucosaminyltransferase